MSASIFENVAQENGWERAMESNPHGQLGS
jgi:hypothetical protein